MHHQDAQPIVAHQPAAGRVGIVVALGVGALGILGLAASVYVSMSGQPGLGLVMAALALWMFVLFLYVLRDAQGKLGWRIEIGTEAVALVLPSGRSLIHRLSAVDTRIPYDNIEAVETRRGGLSQLWLGQYATKLCAQVERRQVGNSWRGQGARNSARQFTS